MYHRRKHGDFFMDSEDFDTTESDFETEIELDSNEYYGEPESYSELDALSYEAQDIYNEQSSEYSKSENIIEAEVSEQEYYSIEGVYNPELGTIILEGTELQGDPEIIASIVEKFEAGHEGLAHTAEFQIGEDFYQSSYHIEGFTLKIDTVKISELEVEAFAEQIDDTDNTDDGHDTRSPIVEAEDLSQLVNSEIAQLGSEEYNQTQSGDSNWFGTEIPSSKNTFDFDIFSEYDKTISEKNGLAVNADPIAAKAETPALFWTNLANATETNVLKTEDKTEKTSGSQNKTLRQPEPLSILGLPVEVKVELPSSQTTNTEKHKAETRPDNEYHKAIREVASELKVPENSTDNSNPKKGQDQLETNGKVKDSSKQPIEAKKAVIVKEKTPAIPNREDKVAEIANYYSTEAGQTHEYEVGIKKEEDKKFKDAGVEKNHTATTDYNQADAEILKTEIPTTDDQQPEQNIYTLENPIILIDNKTEGFENKNETKNTVLFGQTSVESRPNNALMPRAEIEDDETKIDQDFGEPNTNTKSENNSGEKTYIDISRQPELAPLVIQQIEAVGITQESGNTTLVAEKIAGKQQNSEASPKSKEKTEIATKKTAADTQKRAIQIRQNRTRTKTEAQIEPSIKQQEQYDTIEQAKIGKIVEHKNDAEAKQKIEDKTAIEKQRQPIKLIKRSGTEIQIAKKVNQPRTIQRPKPETVNYKVRRQIKRIVSTGPNLEINGGISLVRRSGSIGSDQRDRLEYANRIVKVPANNARRRIIPSNIIRMAQAA